MAQTSPRVFQFKIALKGSKPLIWRRILVPEEYSFFDFHVAIQSTMEWKDYHLHQFEVKNPITGFKDVISTQYHEVDNEMLPGRSLKISKYFLAPKDKANYEYDFGDGWDHSITLEKILPAEKGQQYPQCVDGKNAGPPEDCGGVDGYYDNLRILADPNDKEHQDTINWLKKMDWLSGDFDPKKFDPKAVVFTDPENRWQLINGIGE